MKIVTTVVGSFLCLLTLVSSYAQGFRGIPWKSSIDEVIRREGEPQSRNGQRGDQLISYLRHVGGMGEKTTNFLFTNNKLDTGRYFLGSLTRNQINDLFDSLTKKYGSAKRYQSSFRWTSKDTVISLSNNPFGGQMLTYYEKAHFMHLMMEQEKEKKEGL